MGEEKRFLHGLIVGMVVIIVIDIIYLGGKKIIASYENDGYQLVKSGYSSRVDKLNDILSYVDDEYYFEEDYKEEDLYEGIYEGFLEKLGDPYTVYYTKKEYEEFQLDTSATYEGIGAVVTFNENTKQLMILSPYIGSPAEKAGLLPGDIILTVDGKSIEGLKWEEVVVNMIRGEQGTKVTLGVYRTLDNINKDIEITRDVISVPTVSHEMLDDKIGYMRITGFEEVTYDQFKEALDDLNNKGQEGLIIDLRNNPGGLLNIVIEMADELLPKGLIVYTEDKNGNRKQAYSDEKNKFTKPLVLLVNENSASASEILAGAVKDSKIGTLVGTTTFGKGLVQTVYPLEDGSAIKITVAKYFTPNGNYIHGKGIEPNVKVELPEELSQKLVISREKDTQFIKAVEVMKQLIAKK